LSYGIGRFAADSVIAFPPRVGDSKRLGVGGRVNAHIGFGRFDVTIRRYEIIA
jgi:hypothetical protein